MNGLPSVRCCRTSRAAYHRRNDLASWLRAPPTGIGLTRQLQLHMSVTKLFFGFCWISSRLDVLKRRFDRDARKLVGSDDAHGISPPGQSQSWSPQGSEVLHGDGMCERAEAECCRTWDLQHVKGCSLRRVTWVDQSRPWSRGGIPESILLSLA
jgi:hypothetical protein